MCERWRIKSPELTSLTISQHDSSKDDMLIAGTETVRGLENKGFGEDVGAKVKEWRQWNCRSMVLMVSV